MSPVWEDPRVIDGFRRQLGERARRLDAGEAEVGWKVALGAAAAQRSLGLDGPLLGYLTDATALEEGRLAVGGWAQPALEAELAIELGSELGAGAGREEAAAAISGLGAAIELVDFDRPPAELEQVLAGDVFHRAYALGPLDRSRAGADTAGIEVRVLRDGVEVAAERRPERALGDLVDLTLHVARLLGAFGLRLGAGDVIISGSAVAPLPLQPGAGFRCEYGELGAIELEITP